MLLRHFLQRGISRKEIRPFQRENFFCKLQRIFINEQTIAGNWKRPITPLWTLWRMPIVEVSLLNTLPTTPIAAVLFCMAIYLQVNRVHRGLTRRLSADERSGRKKRTSLLQTSTFSAPSKLKIDAYSPRPELCRRKCLANTRMCVRLIDWSKLKNPNRRTTVVICLVLGLISITESFFSSSPSS